MKLLHTADWHAGRTLKGVNRTPEIHDALQEIAELAKVEAVDAILIAGDVYDKPTPPADAEAAVYDFFVGVAEANIPSIVIAGNHDSAGRLDAAGKLLGRVGAHVLGNVKVAEQGGAFTWQLGDETLQVAALPFISERRLVKLGDVLDADPGKWRQRYQEGMKALVDNLTKTFREDAVNLLMMHTTMEGAELTNSEYQFYCTEDYTVSHTIIPDSCNYVALGHIHKAQPIKDYAGNGGRYAGSLLQLDFGEAGNDKSVFVVEAKVGRPTKLLKQYDISSGKKLKQMSVKLEELERRTPEILGFDGYVKLAISLDSPVPGLKDRVRRELPNVLDIAVRLPERAREHVTGVDFQKVSMLEAFEQYYSEGRDGNLSDDLRQAFRDLYEQVTTS
ncbi:MAG: exonuclease SbcCD subunit D [Deinococcota bacterium]